MQAFIHAGMPKTGTSSIQQFLSEHYEQLIEHQVLYPHAGRQSEHTSQHHAFFLSFLRGVPTPFVKPYQARYDPEIYANQIFGEARQFDANKIVLSSEYLSSEVYELAFLREIKNSLAFCDTIYPVLVLRRPSSFVVSLYNQRIKGFRKATTSASSFLEEMRERNVLDFDQRIRNFEEVFGEENVIVLWYEYINDNIISHFLKILGVEMSPILNPSSRVNSSVDWPTLQAYRMANHLPRGRARARRLVDRVMASVPGSIRRGALARACLPFDAPTLAALDREYAESHGRLSRRKGIAPPPHAGDG